MSDIDETKALAHYGVKGMKWGVKRTRKETAARNQRASAGKRRRTLSDKDLDSYISRLEKEKKLKSLIDDDLRPGKTQVNQILKNAGGKVGTAVAAGVGMYVVRGLITKKWGLDELAGNIPKLKK